MSFARNFALGAQAAGDILDTYYDAREKKGLRDIRQAKVEDIPNAYTTQDAEQLRMLAGVKDAQGNPYYKFDANPDGSYGLRTNFAYQGQDGQMVEPGGVATTFAPRANTVSFMGTRYAPEDLNEDRIAGIRARAMADVVAERDPVRGLAMRQSVKAGERDDKRFAWEEQQQPLKQRGLELQVSANERTERQGVRSDEVQNLVDEVAKMPLEAVQQYAARLNTNESNLPFLMVGQDKSGYKFVTIDPKTGTPLGKEFKVNEAQLRELATASVLGMAGYGAESMTRLSAVNKDIADIVDKMNRTTAGVVESQNDARSKGNADDFKRQGLNIERAGLGLKKDYYNRSSQNMREFVDKDGNSVMLDMSQVPTKDGQYQIPAGLRPKTARPEVTTDQITEYAAQIEATKNPRTGKRYTPEEAMAESRRILTGQADPFMQRLDALLGGGRDPFAK